MLEEDDGVTQRSRTCPNLAQHGGYGDGGGRWSSVSAGRRRRLAGSEASSSSTATGFSDGAKLARVLVGGGFGEEAKRSSGNRREPSTDSVGLFL